MLFELKRVVSLQDQVPSATRVAQLGDQKVLPERPTEGEESTASGILESLDADLAKIDEEILLRIHSAKEITEVQSTENIAEPLVEVTFESQEKEVTSESLLLTKEANVEALLEAGLPKKSDITIKSEDEGQNLTDSKNLINKSQNSYSLENLTDKPTSFNIRDRIADRISQLQNSSRVDLWGELQFEGKCFDNSTMLELKLLEVYIARALAETKSEIQTSYSSLAGVLFVEQNKLDNKVEASEKMNEQISSETEIREMDINVMNASKLVHSNETRDDENETSTTPIRKHSNAKMSPLRNVCDNQMFLQNHLRLTCPVDASNFIIQDSIDDQIETNINKSMSVGNLNKEFPFTIRTEDEKKAKRVVLWPYCGIFDNVTSSISASRDSSMPVLASFKFGEGEDSHITEMQDKINLSESESTVELIQFHEMCHLLDLNAIDVCSSFDDNFTDAINYGNTEIESCENAQEVSHDSLETKFEIFSNTCFVHQLECAFNDNNSVNFHLEVHLIPSDDGAKDAKGDRNNGDKLFDRSFSPFRSAVGLELTCLAGDNMTFTEVSSPENIFLIDGCNFSQIAGSYAVFDQFELLNNRDIFETDRFCFTNSSGFEQYQLVTFLSRSSYKELNEKTSLNLSLSTCFNESLDSNTVQVQNLDAFVEFGDLCFVNSSDFQIFRYTKFSANREYQENEAKTENESEERKREIDATNSMEKGILDVGEKCFENATSLEIYKFRRFSISTANPSDVFSWIKAINQSHDSKPVTDEYSSDHKCFENSTMLEYFYLEKFFKTTIDLLGSKSEVNLTVSSADLLVNETEMFDQFSIDDKCFENSTMLEKSYLELFLQSNHLRADEKSSTNVSIKTEYFEIVERAQFSVDRKCFENSSMLEKYYSVKFFRHSKIPQSETLLTRVNLSVVNESFSTDQLVNVKDMSILSNEDEKKLIQNKTVPTTNEMNSNNTVKINKIISETSSLANEDQFKDKTQDLGMKQKKIESKDEATVIDQKTNENLEGTEKTSKHTEQRSSLDLRSSAPIPDKSMKSEALDTIENAKIGQAKNDSREQLKETSVTKSVHSNVSTEINLKENQTHAKVTADIIHSNFSFEKKLGSFDTEMRLSFANLTVEDILNYSCNESKFGFGFDTEIEPDSEMHELSSKLEIKEALSEPTEMDNDSELTLQFLSDLFKQLHSSNISTSDFVFNSGQFYLKAASIAKILAVAASSDQVKPHIVQTHSSNSVDSGMPLHARLKGNKKGSRSNFTWERVIVTLERSRHTEKGWGSLGWERSNVTW